jgi:hypothetical protein
MDGKTYGNSYKKYILRVSYYIFEVYTGVLYNKVHEHLYFSTDKLVMRGSNSYEQDFNTRWKWTCWNSNNR